MAITHISPAHPWHGVSPGAEAPNVVNVYVEIVPADPVKYEIDKESGLLKVDRPQKYSSYCPTLYGFVPQTYCGRRVGKYCADRINAADILGDGDPLDICVLTEKLITHGNILVRALPIGGLRMLDRNEVDDKIVAVLREDGVYGSLRDINECPQAILERLQHYFLSYKDMPGTVPRKVEMTGVYGAEEAKEVLRLSQEDYRELIAE